MAAGGAFRGRRPRRGRPAGGFTLLELMVALGIGGLTISVVYLMGMGATHEFERQEQIARAQTSLRFAFDLLKRDIVRAGFLSTPNATPPAGTPAQTCGAEPAAWTTGANGPLAAFSWFQNDVAINAANQNVSLNPNLAGNNSAAVYSGDSIVLFGNYETSADYPNIKVVDGNVVRVPQTSYAFQRDFTDWHMGQAGAAQISAQLVNNVFFVGRMVRIQTLRRLRHFAHITAVNVPPVGSAQDLVLTLDVAIPTTCWGDGEGGSIAPMSAIQLSLMDRPGSVRRNSVEPEIAQLMRREVQPANKAALLDVQPANGVFNTRSLLDFAVAFHLAFTMTNVTASGQPDAYAIGDTTNVPLVVNAAPERIRAVTIDLAVRTALPDRYMKWNTGPWTTAGCAADFKCFRLVSAAGQGVARVRRLRGEVFVPNVAFEGY